MENEEGGEDLLSDHDDDVSSGSEPDIGDHGSFYDTDDDNDEHDDSIADIFHSLDYEDTLHRLQRNDPVISDLCVYEDAWVEGAGKAIADSQVLKGIHVDSHSWRGTSWIQELCRGLARNRSLERFGLESNSTEHMDIFQNITPFFKHNHNLRCIEVDDPTPQALQSLSMVLLSKCEKLESIKKGCAALATLLNNRASKIQELELNGTSFLEDECMAIIGEAVIGHNTLRILNLDGIGSLRDSDWISIASFLSHPMCLLETLSIRCTGIDDKSAILLGNALVMNNALKYLNMSDNDDITSAGWKGFSNCLRNPVARLEFLTATNCSIDDDGFKAIFSALGGNSSLKGLNVHGNDVIIDSEVSTFLSHVLCDKTSINGTYSSNHTLQSLRGYYCTADFKLDTLELITTVLATNRNEDKLEVARRKILEHHFSERSSDLHVFACMPDSMMPSVIAWIGRNSFGCTLMFNFVRGFPVLFNSRYESPLGMRKRKR